MKMNEDDSWKNWKLQHFDCLITMEGDLFD